MEKLQRYTILIVDDAKMNLMTLYRILSQDYAVLAAKNGLDALSQAEKYAPDLILLDIMMPDIDGFEVLVRLKESPNTQNIPVIIITGLDNVDGEIKGFSLGAVDYITKPFQSDIVRARVKTQIKIISQMQTIEKLSLMDPLTGIANRRCFDDRMAMEWKRAIRDQAPISFLMMDIDKFKTYNDTYGHPQGDVLLKMAAQVFTAAARRPADLAARLGGEEFGVLLPYANLENALAVAEKIRSGVENMRTPTADESVITTATISIGVVSAVPRETDLIKEFISEADACLYNAKNTGRNRIFSRAARCCGAAG
ncbi:MAG: diguanylate cyclase [Gracilibacteraceae bacterium]|jgi:diguanylate cyclase (GGDEF)-like protein|nr:diguanylate cyclase [Gracilibacteraceae bacterium]